MLRHLPLILAMALGAMPNAWAAAAAEPDAGKSTQAPKSAQVQSSAASAPPSKTLAKKPIPKRSVPAASPDANPLGKAPPLGLCDGS